MEMYNHTIKNEYLNTFENEDVRELIKSLFLKSKTSEEFYDKDLHSFNLDQIEEVMRNINPTTLNSISNTKSRINTYIQWAIKNGRRVSNINPLQGAGKDWDYKFLDEVSKRHMSETDIYDLTEDLLNAQDQALIQCIFEGISGQTMSELLSMNFNRINWNNNEIEVRNNKDGVYRKITVSNRCMKFIENAYKQKYYISEDTEQEKDLVEFNGNIFKNTAWTRTKIKEVTAANLAKRLYTIKKKYELDVFNVKSIGDSGKIKMAADLARENDGVISKEEFTKIGDKFNVGKMRVGKYEYYDTAKMKNIINEETLKELYDIEVSF